MMRTTSAPPHQPILTVANMPVFQQPSIRAPLTPHMNASAFADAPWWRIASNEQALPQFRGALSGRGGTMIAVGSLHTLSLAAAAHASALILVEFSLPVLFKTLLLLAHTSHHTTRQDYLAAMTHCCATNDIATLGTPFPHTFQAAAGRLLQHLEGQCWGDIPDVLHRGAITPDHLAGSDTVYHYARTLVSAGRFAFLYADVFAPDTPGLMATAQQHCGGDVLRTLYLSNAMSWLTDPYLRNGATDLAPLATMLRHPSIDPTGQCLLTIPTPRRAHHFSYHVVPFADAAHALTATPKELLRSLASDNG